VEGQLQPGDEVLGKLRVIRLLGAGGLGAVYEVEHTLTKHRRALKLLHPKYRSDPEVVQRFLREASAAGHIGNPHIVEMFDAGSLPSGEPYLLMEMLQGQPLSALFRDEGRLPIGLAASLVHQAARALEDVHRSGVVHRDLKPDNLFVVTRDGRPFVKVLDFGISRFDSALTGALTVTRAGTAMGTPLYMAPEQMRGAHDVDGRADLYALGVILYEALAGGLPYWAESFAELSALVLGGQPRPLSEHRPDVPAPLAAIVHRALSPDRDQRFSSAAELAASLEPFVDATDRSPEPSRHQVGDTVQALATPHTTPATRQPTPSPMVPIVKPTPAKTSKGPRIVLFASLALILMPCGLCLIAMLNSEPFEGPSKVAASVDGEPSEGIDSTARTVCDGMINGNICNGDELLSCRNGTLEAREGCEYGCARKSWGFSDRCRFPDDSGDFDSEVDFCHGRLNGLSCNGKDLHRCSNGVIERTQRCPWRCVVMPHGQQDRCL
jgi:serine/threonine protein kinase